MAQAMGSEAAGPAPRVWDTRDVGAGDAFGYYREGICEAFMELVPEAEAPVQAHFRARVESVAIGPGAVNRVAATSHQVLRTKREIARAPSECFYLNYQTGGACEIAQAGRGVTLRPGDVGIFDSAAPFALEHRTRPSLGVCSFWVPHAALRERLPTGLPVGPVLLSRHPTLGRLIAEAARTLGEGAEHMAQAEADRLFGMLLDLTGMALAGGQARADRSRTRAAAMLLALKTEAERAIADPRLSAGSLARRCGVSERWVHRLFEREDLSFGAWLLQRRLARAAMMLRDPALAHLPIATIAYDCGFSDMSHFGRSFRARNGCTPGEWRRGA